MNVTPLDLRQQKFKTAMRGYDRGEVDALLAEVADDYEGALRDADRLRQDVARLEAMLAEHRSEEKSLRNTLVSAQRLADELRDTAEHDGQRMIREAETRADLLIQKAQGRLEELQREIEGLRSRRRETETSVEAIINALKNTLDFVREQDARERDDKIRLLRPRATESGTGITPAGAANEPAVRSQNG
ncbi:MAG: DivIVA domain-containing protein [Acidobacteriota bacterium]